MEERQISFNSKFGTIYICANVNGISYLGWEDQNRPAPTPSCDLRVKSYLASAQDELIEYFAGSRKEFSLPISLERGTDFQKKVWAELLKIPYGQVSNYSDIAQKVGSPKAVQAVGSANGKNPICLIVPCHRVIAKSGELSGYVAGANIKEALLNLEGALI